MFSLGIVRFGVFRLFLFVMLRCQLACFGLDVWGVLVCVFGLIVELSYLGSA